MRKLLPLGLCLAALLLAAADPVPAPAPDMPKVIPVPTNEAPSDIPPDWAALHDESLSTEAGKKYEAAAVKAFWGENQFMYYCVPEGTESPAPLTIYFMVSTDGKMKDIQIDPENEVANCIHRNVAGHTFPPPPDGRPYVAKIDMQFFRHWEAR